MGFTSIENSQGVLPLEKSPASSSDIRELQAIVNNRTQLLSSNISIEWSINNSILSLTSINLKNKVVSKLNNIFITLDSLINKIHFFTREVSISTKEDLVYLYGLRSNSQTLISGADIPADNNIESEILEEIVSTRTLTEWTFIVSDTIPALTGWTYEGSLVISNAGAGSGASSSDPGNQYVVDYIVTGTATLEDINSDARNNSFSGRSTVLNLNDITRDFNIYQWTGSAWVVVESAALSNMIVQASDTLTESRLVDPSKRLPSYAFIYENNGSLDFKVQLLSSTSGNYVLPIASSTTLGGIKVGNNLSITSDGTLNGTPDTKYTLPTASSTVLGGIKVGEGLTTSSDGTLSINPYNLPKASITQLGVIKVGANLSIADDGTLNALESGESGESPVTSVFGRIGAVTAQNGDYSASQITYGENSTVSAELQKLQEDLTKLEAQELPIASSTTLGGVKIGEGLSITPDGVLSSDPNGGSNYELPIASSTTLGGVKVGNNLAISNDGTLIANQQSVPGNAGTATELLNPRGILVDLESNSSSNFNGTSDVSPGVTGVLPLIHGGVGASTPEEARANLGAVGTSDLANATTVKYTIQVPADYWRRYSLPTGYMAIIMVSGMTKDTILSDIQLDPSLVGDSAAELAFSQWTYLNTNNELVEFYTEVLPTSDFTIIAREVK